ncbi:scm-like with four MBT domains protein 1 [Physella acuta]|uniref:scm-like with four MBT domains protein 1 n=1 Tax=Physella acuta TaxID=109671 RepID=UPI0027DC0AAF|nr:scm-like with four MBT domains protein 1 [Physella acuta]XP_059151099.1 scm-like with four MBT domains protein 1 [Physella acuta]XP_059151100.1 scm-like with four MBT domains protein 1 [Physella acuta]
MPITPTPLVGTSVSPMANSSSMQPLTHSPVNITPISMEMLNSATSGAIVSLPSSFCFPSNQMGVASNAANSGAQLNAMSLGSMFSVNPAGMSPQFVQPLTVSQQQALTLSLSQQQHQGQNLPVSHSITIGQVPQNMGIVSQPLPLGQVVCSSVASPNLSFMTPTVFTMSNPTGQNQYLSNPYSPFPIMLGNQQNIFTSINTAATLPSQSVEASSVSQVSGPSPLPHIPHSLQMPSNLTNSMSHITNHQVSLSQLSSNSISLSQIPNTPVSLDSQPVSVFSFPSPAMSINLPAKSVEINSQPSPDTTNSHSTDAVIVNNSVELLSKPDISNVVSSSTSSSFYPASSPSPVSESKDIQTTIKKESSPVILFDVKPLVGCARMKYTPIEKDNSRITDVRKNLVNMREEDSYLENTEAENIGSELTPDRVTPEINFKSLGIKIEICDELGQDDGNKHSLSPIESLELVKKNENHSESNTKADAMGDLADVEDLEDVEFVWEDYLKETGASAVPPTAFKHVEVSLQSGFSKGMKLEAPNKHNPNTYWIATVVMTCGPLLRLRYEGYKDNSSADFWSDPMTSDIHPIGWCEVNNKTLQPPEALQEKIPDWHEFLNVCLKDAITAPSYLLDKSTGATPVDQIKEGMRLEIQNKTRPDKVWLVKIVENIGGRLYLRYEGLETATHDFWLFYLDEKLHPIGWCNLSGYEYHPPEVVIEKSGKSEKELSEVLQAALDDATSQKLPADIFKDQPTIETHNFEIGMKLEAVDPTNGNSICPSTVIDVIDKKYFIVEIDDLRKSNNLRKVQFSCHRNTPTIFPINWAVSKGIKLAMPQGWDQPDFKWSDYLVACKAVPAPGNLFNMDLPEHEFECGMKLEAVKPSQPSQIYAATITKIVEHLMWIHIDSSKRMMDSHVESVNSFNLFPIGWCVSNGYQLKPPGRILGSSPSKRRIAIVQPELADNQKTDYQVHSSTGRELFGGPQIYFNHRCFSGPYLSKGRIAELPRCVGPGPVTLVMKEVLSMLINTAYKSCRVLRELQLDGRPNPNLTQQLLKAKYKGKSYRAIVEICRTASQLEDFCRHICMKLECCPNLISPHFVNGRCPENCAQLTKTKYTYYYGKRKKKIGRPPGGHSNLENGPKKTGKNKKRKNFGLIGSKRSTQPSVHDHGENDDDKASVCSDTKTVDSTSTTGSKERAESKSSKNNLKRRYTHHIPPPSEIRTRGAKLPKYSFEKRTHKKIMIVEGSQQSVKTRKETIKTSRMLRESQQSSESSFSSIRPEMPVTLKSEPPLKLDKNPLEWTVSEVGDFLQTTDCADRELVARLKTEEIDGQALLLLTLPNVQEYMGIKLGPAIKLCHLIERIKIAFYESFAK